jgi:Bacterial PH domain
MSGPVPPDPVTSDTPIRNGSAAIGSPTAGSGFGTSPDMTGSGKLGKKLRAAWKTDASGRTTFRLMPPLVLWWAWLVFVAINIVDLVIQSHDWFAVEIVVGLAAATGLMYACALRPRVVTDASGLTVQNPFRDYVVPWGGVTGVFVGDSVEISCLRPVPKPEKTVYSWALYSPRRARARAELRTGMGTGQSRQRHDARARRRYQIPDGTTFGRMPQQAKEIASKHPSHIMATELARRCDQARQDGAPEGVVAGRWAWLSIVAVVIPIAALVVVLAAR